MVKKFFVGIVVMILLMNIVLVSAIQYEEITPENLPFSFTSWFKHTFNIQDFSVVGVQRQCDRTVKSGNTIYFSTSGETVLMDIDAADFCSSGYGLIDIYVDGWTPFKEYRDETGYIGCRGTYDECVAEVYCCDYPQCSSDSQCEDRYSEGSTCETETCSSWKPEIGGYRCPGESDIPYEFSSFRFCEDAEFIDCYYYDGTGTVCKSVLQIDCDVTYKTYELFESRSACEGEAEKTCWKLENNQCSSLNVFATSCTDKGYYSSKTACDSNIGFVKNCWDYKSSSNTCIQVDEITPFQSKTCSDFDKWSSESDCKSANGLIVDGTGDGTGGTGDIGGTGGTGGTDGNINLQKGITKSDVKKLTSTDLLKSSCTETSQCDEGICNTIKSLENDGTLTSAQSEKYFEDTSKIISTSGGALIGVGACSIVAGAAGVTTFGAGFALFPLCAVIGGVGGLGADTAFNAIIGAFSSKDKESAGFCIIEEDALEKFFGWAGIFDIDRDGDKDGFDGLIVGAIGLVLLSRLFVFGRFEYEIN